MGILDWLTGRGPDVPRDVVVTALREQVGDLREQVDLLRQQLLEPGWVRLASDGRALSRGEVLAIGDAAAAMWLKNPLIRRGVQVHEYYVWGQGVSVHATDDRVSDVVSSLADDRAARRALFGSGAARERDLLLYGNVFLLLDVSQAGLPVLSVVPFREMVDVALDGPGGAPLLYLRERVDEQGRVQRSWHPTVDAWLEGRRTPGQHKGVAVAWDAPLLHVRSAALPGMVWGVSDLYPALDWALAYKTYLEDVASYTHSLTRWAWRVTAATDDAFEAARASLAAATGGDYPQTGGAFLAAGVDIQPVRVQGAAPDADQGRRLMLMVAAALGLPETFFGDADVGSRATAKTLDRPTELRMRDRQTLWAEAIKAVCAVAVAKAQKEGTVPADPSLREAVEVVWPPILSHDVEASVAAVVRAATLDGKPLQGPFAGGDGIRVLARMLLEALGEDDVDALIDALLPGPEQAAPAAAAAPAGQGGGQESLGPDDVLRALDRVLEVVRDAVVAQRKADSDAVQAAVATVREVGRMVEGQADALRALRDALVEAREREPVERTVTRLLWEGDRVVGAVEERETTDTATEDDIVLGLSDDEED